MVTPGHDWKPPSGSCLRGIDSGDREHRGARVRPPRGFAARERGQCHLRGQLKWTCRGGEALAASSSRRLWQRTRCERRGVAPVYRCGRPARCDAAVTKAAGRFMRGGVKLVSRIPPLGRHASGGALRVGVRIACRRSPPDVAGTMHLRYQADRRCIFLAESQPSRRASLVSGRRQLRNWLGGRRRRGIPICGRRRSVSLAVSWPANISRLHTFILAASVPRGSCFKFMQSVSGSARQSGDVEMDE